MKTILIEQLITHVLIAMLDFKLSEGTMKSYKYSCYSPIKKFFKDKNELWYCKEITDEFLKNEKKRLDNCEISKRHYRKLRKAINLLEEYNQTGSVKWNVSTNRSKIKLNDYFTSILVEYVSNISKCLAPSTISYIKSISLQFFKYLEDNAHKNLDNISVSDIKNFLLDISSKHSGSMANVIFSMKKLFKYLNDIKITEINAEIILQKPASPRKKVLSYFSHGEVSEMLNQIDTTTSEGKRDYAIIYLASHTGLRCIDIVNLKLSDIDWIKGEIYIVQAKTGNFIVLPLELDTRTVIADYILTGRPNTQSPYIFIRAVAPYTKLCNGGAGRNIIKKYRCKTEKAYSPGDGKGFHALRRSIGTWMLEADVPLPTISQVLGHRNMDSTKQYLSINHIALVVCALNLNGIKTKKEGLV